MSVEESARRPAKRGSMGLAIALIAFVAGGASPATAQAIKVGSFTKTTGGAPATQLVPHGLGQTPKAIILWTEGKTNQSFSPNSLYAFGMTDGTTSKSVAMASQTSSFTQVAGRLLANRPLTIVDWNPIVLAEADLQSWDANNFTLNWIVNNATAYVVHFIAIGGPGVSAKVVSWTMGTTIGSKAVTGVGFAPDLVLHAHAGN